MESKEAKQKRLLRNRIFYMTAAQVAHDKPQVARWCGEYLQELAHAEGQKMNALDLHQAAVALTVKLATIAHEVDSTGDWQDEGGVVAAEELGRLSPLILIRDNLGERRRAQVIAHELVTSLQRTHVARECYGVERVECKELDGRRVRHDIAQIAERLLVE